MKAKKQLFCKLWFVGWFAGFANVLFVWWGFFVFVEEEKQNKFIQICTNLSTMNFSFFTLAYNGWQYGQWRFAGFVTIHRCKPLCGVESFKLLLPPPLAILRVIGWLYFPIVLLILSIKFSKLVNVVNDRLGKMSSLFRKK